MSSPDRTPSPIDLPAVQGLVGRWWMTYDAADFDRLAALLTDDTRFTCRTDTGQAEWEEFVRADLRGRDEVMAWQRQHRLDSPDPLRHATDDLHLVDESPAQPEQVGFRAYLRAAQIVAMAPTPLPGGVLTGVARRVGDQVLLAELHVVLDTLESIPLAERRGGAAP